MPTLDPWFMHNLVCPADRSPLQWDGERLHGACGHSYAVIGGIPVLLRADVEQTHSSGDRSLEAVGARSEHAQDELGDHTQPSVGAVSGVHPFVQRQLVATHGNMYADVTATTYPIPNLRLANAQGEQWLLDVGCNWGRWSIAASRKGYRVVGVDSSLEAVTVARDVAKQLGATPLFVAADGRYLPFRDNTFDVVYSFSVLQHFAKADVREALRSIRRVLEDDGVSLIQILNRVGVRSLYNQSKLSFRDGDRFDVRYWTTRELADTFASTIGPSEIAVDAFFSANAQPSDIPMLPRKYQLVVRASEKLRGLANRVPALKHVADSLFVTSSTDPLRLAQANAYVRRA